MNGERIVRRKSCKGHTKNSVDNAVDCVATRSVRFIVIVFLSSRDAALRYVELIKTISAN